MYSSLSYCFQKPASIWTFFLLRKKKINILKFAVTKMWEDLAVKIKKKRMLRSFNCKLIV